MTNNNQDDKKIVNEAVGWMGIGIALGVGIGAALDNVALGIAIGIAVGAAIGTMRSRRKE